MSRFLEPGMEQEVESVLEALVVDNSDDSEEALLDVLGDWRVDTDE